MTLIQGLDQTLSLLRKGRAHQTTRVRSTSGKGACDFQHSFGILIRCKQPGLLTRTGRSVVKDLDPLRALNKRDNSFCPLSAPIRNFVIYMLLGNQSQGFPLFELRMLKSRFCGLGHYDEITCFSSLSPQYKHADGRLLLFSIILTYGS